MAVHLQDHIHLGTALHVSEHAPTAKYSVRQGGFDQTPDVPLAIDRAVTGKLHVHILADGSGNPRQFEAGKYTLMVQDADVDVLRALFGKIVYFVPLKHPDDGEDHITYRKQVVVTIRQGGIVNIDPLGDWWLVTIEIQEKT